LRIEHVNSSVKRCRIAKDRIRLWKQGVRDLVMEICCALHNFRVRLTPGNLWFNRDKLNGKPDKRFAASHPSATPPSGLGTQPRKVGRAAETRQASRS
jgi:hypothetical protein